MIGIVVVSHSRALAEAAVALACEMVPAEARPRIAVAAGLDETTFGTDAAAIADAIGEVTSPDGVLCLMDLGSALLSAEMACEFLDPDVASLVRLSAAPLIEGLVAAVVTASAGATLDEVDREARAGLLGKTEQLTPPEDSPTPSPTDDSPTGEAALELRHTIANPHGLHARPAGRLVSALRGLTADVRVRNDTRGTGPVDARSMTRVAALDLRRGDLLVVTATGPDAQAAIDRLAALAADDFGESDEAPPTPAPATPTGTGRQVVVGPARRLTSVVDTSTYVSGTPDEEAARLASAVAIVKTHLDGLAAQAPAQAAIVGVQTAVLDDPALTEAVEADLVRGVAAVDAVAEHYGEAAGRFAAVADPYLAERAQDVRSVERLLLAALMGNAMDDAASGILVVDELDAATAARLDPGECLGVVTVTGGATGHGTILATSRGIPVLTGRADAAAVTDGTLVAFDPVRKTLWVDPTPDELSEISRLAESRSAEDATAAAAAGGEARTSTGQRVLVKANIASLADGDASVAAGADGSGLVRTELLFASWATAPTSAEQAEVFAGIARTLGRPITIRTWDPGADKPLPFLTQGVETNPMLGERGIRAMRRRPDLLREQLRAVVMTAREAEVRVMFPMVTEPEELRWARGVLAEVPGSGSVELPVGMMVEVPAAAIRAADFAGLVDFVSIGTNDLTQYTTAADRDNGQVAGLARPDSAAVRDLIAATVAGLPGIPVAVCGDLASDPEATGTLIGLGITEFSVRPPLVGVIKQAARRA